MIPIIMFGKFKSYENENLLKCKLFIKNTIYNIKTISYEKIYQIYEDFVHLKE